MGICSGFWGQPGVDYMDEWRRMNVTVVQLENRTVSTSRTRAVPRIGYYPNEKRHPGRIDGGGPGRPP